MVREPGQLGTLPAMAGRRGWGEDSIYFDHSGECRDVETHRHCPGHWRGVISLKPGPDGQRQRKKVSGKNKSEVRAKLAELHDELNDGVVTNAAYTLAQAINDWLADGLIGAARSHGLYAYIVLSLLVGVRTEEARALRWDHVDLEGNPDADPPVPPHVDVWRSVRAHGDTKTKKSRGNPLEVWTLPVSGFL